MSGFSPGVGGRLAGRLLAVFGWRIVFEPPPGPKAVLAFYPHTSNWDFVVGILVRAALGFPVRWAAKDTLFRGPFGTLWAKLGGIPVNRRRQSGFVSQMAAEFGRRQELYLVIAPEGTRAKVQRWKSGFYHVARAANVPLGLAFIDYARREIGVLGYLSLDGDVATDMNRVRAFYQGRQGLHPALAGPIGLAEESTAP